MKSSQAKKKLNEQLVLTATPEVEDFRGKYEVGGIGKKLLDEYFNSVESLSKAVKIGSKAKVIEIGCGEGLSTKRISSFLPKGVNFEASEYVKEQIKFAKANNKGLKVTQESIYELKHRENSFDLVFLLEVLEHLDYPDKGLEEVYRILKPGGCLIVGVPREPLWRLLNMARGKYLNEFGNTPGHLQHWSRNSFVKFVANNFGEVRSTISPIPWTLILAEKKK